MGRLSLNVRSQILFCFLTIGLFSPTVLANYPLSEIELERISDRLNLSREWTLRLVTDPNTRQDFQTLQEVLNLMETKGNDVSRKLSELMPTFLYARTAPPCVLRLLNWRQWPLLIRFYDPDLQLVRDTMKALQLTVSPSAQRLLADHLRQYDRSDWSSSAHRLFFDRFHANLARLINRKFDSYRKVYANHRVDLHLVGQDPALLVHGNVAPRGIRASIIKQTSPAHLHQLIENFAKRFAGKIGWFGLFSSSISKDSTVFSHHLSRYLDQEGIPSGAFRAFLEETLGVYRTTIREIVEPCMYSPEKLGANFSGHFCQVARALQNRLVEFDAIERANQDLAPPARLNVIFPDDATPRPQHRRRKRVFEPDQSETAVASETPQFFLTVSSEAHKQIQEIESDRSNVGLRNQVRKTLRFLEANPQHPGLRSHRLHVVGKGIWISYAQNSTPQAFRILWKFGGAKGEIEILAVIPHY